MDHLNYNTTEYITLLLEYLYDYIFKLSAILSELIIFTSTHRIASRCSFILGDAQESVKYNTKDISRAVASIESWLQTIRQLLYPNSTTPKNTKICDEGS